ncbi:MAG: type IV secretory system conjugative DNA transfer family protein, partial [Candidatus Afipia apatlaquensis]|nr:type IV secretory system conjugative DNA transfer family protein [Candidatus Afipia apatlaquensis]
ADEIVMVSGTPPIRAKKARYFEDRRFQERILPPPALAKTAAAKSDDWSKMPLPPRPEIGGAAAKDGQGDDEDPTGSERRHQPELNKAGTVEKKAPIDNEFDLDGPDDADDDAARARRLNQVMQGVARQVSLDPNDGMDL